jgi:hypothetical protein
MFSSPVMRRYASSVGAFPERGSINRPSPPPTQNKLFQTRVPDHLIAARLLVFDDHHIMVLRSDQSIATYLMFACTCHRFCDFVLTMPSIIPATLTLTLRQTLKVPLPKLRRSSSTQRIVTMAPLNEDEALLRSASRRYGARG